MEIKFADLERLFEKIKKVLDALEKINTYDRYFNLYLANGECLYYTVPKNRIPHLLGIKTEGLINHKVFGNETNSFELLKLLLDNAYKINKLVTEGKLKYEEIFSEYIETKVDSIIDNIRIDVEKTEFICQYDNTRNFYDGNNGEKCNYIMVKKYEDGKVGIITIVKENNGFVPMSNRTYENIEDADKDLKRLLNHQVLTIITGLKLGYHNSSYENNYSLNLNSITNKVKKIEKYKEKYNATADTNHQLAYSSNMAKYRNEEQQDENINISIIAECIKNRMIIKSIPEYSRLISIVNAINDLLFRLDNNDIDSSTSYTELMSELNKLKSELLEAQSKIDELSTNCDKLSSQNTELKAENCNLNKKVQKIYQIVKPS